MNELFLTLLNMSIAASWTILALLLLRPLLRKAPKWISCTLWAIPALRLLIPVFWESHISLLPSSQVFPTDIAQAETPIIYSGISEVNSAVNPILTRQADSLSGLLAIATLVWLIGLGIMLLYSLISWLYLRYTVRASLHYRERIYLCDQVKSPFIFGILRPRIYLPSGLDGATMTHVLAHENAHLKRRDHLWKPLGYLLLSIYWFNPVLWVAYILLCRDIERACDEKVLTGIDDSAKKDYAKALVDCSTHRRMILTCPVAFGEVSVKSRVKAILNYKKPTFWIIVIALIAGTITAVCFLTNPETCGHDYCSEVTVSPTCISQGIRTNTCRLCDHVYTQTIPFTDHIYEAGTIIKAASCSEEGLQQYRCTVCSADKCEPLKKLQHQLTDFTVTKEPNCTEEGECVGLCKACGDPAATSKLPTNGNHIFTGTTIRSATCTKPGEGINTCTLCQYSEPCQYPIIAHSYVPKTILKEPTCTSSGSQEVICSHCQQSETVAITALGHCWEGATCTKAAVCSLCNATGKKTDHSYEITHEEQTRKTNTASKRIKKCNFCGKQKTEYVTDSYVYDLSSIAAQVASYAEKRGFNANISTASFMEDDFHICAFLRNKPSPASLVAEAKKAIDQAYNQYVTNQAGPEQYTVNIHVSYGESGFTNSGYFNVCIDIS